MDFMITGIPGSWGFSAELLSDGWLREGDLHGLQPEKIVKIKHEASFFAESNL
jgi:hypothetical protein